MKRLVGALALALILLVTPFVLGEHRQNDYLNTVRWAGCQAGLVTDDSKLVLDSFYNPPTSTLFIGTQDYPGLSQDLAEMVLLHEIGHCLQDQAGLLATMEPIARELDADRWAADLACSMGRDGQKLLRDIFIWANQTFGYEGDSMHGTLAQRIAQGQNAAVCVLGLTRPRPQSP